MTRTRSIVVLIGTLLIGGAALSSPPERPVRRIALCTPHDRDDTFWKLFDGLMKAAAADLDLEIVTFHAKDSRDEMKAQIHRAATGPDAVDALVFQSFKQGGRSFLEIAEQAGVPAFLVNAGLSPADRADLGGPRGEYDTWIGEMLPDDRGAGELLLDELIGRAGASEDAPVRMIALTGILSDGASIERLAGMRRALEGRRDVVLQQVVSANWRRDAARRRTAVLLQRYPKTRVIWAANDPMALGAIDAIKEAGSVPGRDILVGGVDWTAAALDAIERGELTCSAGGHFMEGAWVAVLLHDYLAGRDFSADRLAFRSPMSLITRENVEELRAVVEPETWRRCRFGDLSRAAHPERAEYRFGPERLLDLQSGPEGVD